MLSISDDLSTPSDDSLDQRTCKDLENSTVDGAGTFGFWKSRPITAATASTLFVSGLSRESRLPMTSRSPSGIYMAREMSVLGRWSCPLPSRWRKSSPTRYRRTSWTKRGLPSVWRWTCSASAQGTSRPAMCPASPARHRQSAQRDATEVRDPAQFGEGTREGVSTVHLHVAVGPDDHQPRPFEAGRDVGKHVQGALVRPVQVFQDDDERRHVGGVTEEGGHALEQAPAVVFRVAARRQ